MNFQLCALILIIFFFFGCKKTDPAPELRDEIYKDLIIELDIAQKSIEAEEKNLLRLQADLKKAVPQTGQIKFATKKVRDSESRLDQLRQQKIFFEIKLERRKEEVRFKYAQSLKPNGPPWPDEKEIEMYKTITQFQRSKNQWEQTKGYKEDKNVPRGTKVESSPENKGH